MATAVVKPAMQHKLPKEKWATMFTELRTIFDDGPIDKAFWKKYQIEGIYMRVYNLVIHSPSAEASWKLVKFFLLKVRSQHSETAKKDLRDAFMYLCRTVILNRGGEDACNDRMNAEFLAGRLKGLDPSAQAMLEAQNWDV